MGPLFYLVGTLVLGVGCLGSRFIYSAPLGRFISRVSRLVANRPWFATVAIFLLACGACWGLSQRGALPSPGTHDEFGYLLEADTFAHGRLTNPTHPLWMHFESIHIIQQPSYTAKFPPGQAVLLALGWILCGHPIAGVWFSYALACAAICWMLQAWLPLRWAFLGGVLAILLFGPTTWANSYWGGAVAALGGALVFGAVRRLVTDLRVRWALVLALGIAILANTRPYEGLIVTLAALGCLGFLLLPGGGWRRQQFWGRLVVPLLICLTATAGCMFWYNYRVTGTPWRMPYQVHDATYAAAPLFFWQAPFTSTPTYHHQSMQDYYVGYELPRFLRKRFLLGFNSSLATKVYIFGKFFIGPFFLVPALLLVRFNRGSWLRFAAVVCLVEFLALSQTLYFFPHYAAPIAGLMLVLLVQGLRQIRLWTFKGGKAGRVFVGGAVALSCVGLIQFCMTPAGTTARENVQANLKKMDGKHLVVVRYGPSHDCHQEWVYNDADIDAARIVWARDLGAVANEPLLHHFGTRKHWLLTLDDGPLALVPYEIPAATASLK